MVLTVCIAQIQRWKDVRDHAGFTAPTRQHELHHTHHTDHTDDTDDTDEESICPEEARS